MENLLSSLSVTVFVSLLAFLAQWSRKSRRAEISLWVVIVFLSLLSLATGALLGAVSFSGQAPTGVLSPGLLTVVAGAVGAAGLIGLILCVPTLLKILGRRPSGGFWTDPPIFFACWLFVTVLLANNLVGILSFEHLERAGVFSLGTGGRVSPGAILASQLPFVAVALVGVGIGVRRGWRETLARLGYGPISLKHLGLVALFVVGAFALSVGADYLFSQAQPGLYREVGRVSRALFDPRGLGPVAAVLFALLIGIGAGLGEETLFRGAVQPVFGILPTSLLFASMHVQYGPSLLLGFIFLLSAGLGLLRRYINTTASFVAHASYNALTILAAYFFGM